jgi:hypothetical protein
VLSAAHFPSAGFGRAYAFLCAPPLRRTRSIVSCREGLHLIVIVLSLLLTTAAAGGSAAQHSALPSTSAPNSPVKRSPAQSSPVFSEGNELDEAQEHQDEHDSDEGDLIGMFRCSVAAQAHCNRCYSYGILAHAAALWSSHLTGVRGAYLV